MFKLLQRATLAPALRPSLPMLGISTLTAALSGLAILGAWWCVIQLLTQLNPTWATPALTLWVLAVGLWITGAVLSALSSWLAHHAEAKFSGRLRRTVANHLTRLPASTLAKQDSNALRRLVSEDITALHHMVAHLPAEISTLAIIPLASIGLLVSMAGPVALLALLPGALGAAYYLLFIPRFAAKHGATQIRVMGEIVSAVDDYARGIRINRIYGAQSGALASYRNAAQRFTQGMVDWVSHVATPAAIAAALLQAVATFAIAYTVSYQHGTTALAAALFFSLAIVTPALKLGHGLDYVSAGQAAADRLATLLELPIVPSGTATLSPLIPPVIELQQVGLAIDGRPILQGLNHRFEPNSITAITGPSGTGKSTLLRALAGLEPISTGRILLAQTEIQHLEESARHHAICFVPQGGDVLAASVRENLQLSAPSAASEDWSQALAHAQLPIDLDTDASQLSGGEQQRLGLAHAFLTTAPVILLDEPTSALDTNTASALLNALRALARQQHKTIVMVTHDKALAANVDHHLALPCLNAQGEQA